MYYWLWCWTEICYVGYNVRCITYVILRVWWGINLSVISRQSVQWQMNVSTKPLPSVGTTSLSASFSWIPHRISSMWARERSSCILRSTPLARTDIRPGIQPWEQTRSQYAILFWIERVPQDFIDLINLQRSQAMVYLAIAAVLLKRAASRSTSYSSPQIKWTMQACAMVWAEAVWLVRIGLKTWNPIPSRTVYRYQSFRLLCVE